MTDQINYPGWLYVNGQYVTVDNFRYWAIRFCWWEYVRLDYEMRAIIRNTARIVKNDPSLLQSGVHTILENVAARRERP